MDIKSKIGDIVASDFRSAAIFKKNGIDFCCGGGKTIENVCQSKGLDGDTILAELNALDAVTTASENYKDWTLARLIDHILDKHHSYTRRTIADLTQYLDKVARVHGQHNPELHDIRQKFIQLAEELISHMEKEEGILFPGIKLLEANMQSGEDYVPPVYSTVKNPIFLMENEHEIAGNIMSEIRSLSSNFTPPQHACNTYIVSFKLLEEFENDLHKHIHLENNILFPKSLELEKLSYEHDTTQ